MFVFTQEQVDRLARATFFRNLEERIEAVEGQPADLTPAQRAALWAAASDAARYGIVSIGACLALCHIYWELGLDCIQKIPAMAAILADEQAGETQKIEALWSVRTALLAALKGA
jgi:hypothetical protein